MAQTQNHKDNSLREVSEVGLSKVSWAPVVGQDYPHVHEHFWQLQ